MWPLRKINTSADHRSPRSRNFSCSSFKDIHDLLYDDRPDSLPRSPSVFHRNRIYASAASPHRQASSLPKNPDGPVTLYYTSLRVVRKTFEDCRAVRSILRGYDVTVEERDLLADSRHVAELRGILGCRAMKGGIPLPSVFVRSSYIGGAEEVRRLHERGDLRATIEGVPPAGCGGPGNVGLLLRQRAEPVLPMYGPKRPIGLEAQNRQHSSMFSLSPCYR